LNSTLNQVGLILAGGNASVSAGGNINQSGSVIAAGTASLTAGGSLSQSNTVTAGADASLVATGGTLSQSGVVTAGGNASLTAGADLNQSNVVTAQGNASLTAGGNLGQSGTVTAKTGDAVLTAAGGLTESGAVSAGTFANLSAGGDLTQSGVTGAATSASLTAGGALTQTGAVTAGTSASLTAGGSLIQNGAVAAGSNATLLAQGDLSAGSASTIRAGQNAVLRSAAGNIALGGSITAPDVQIVSSRSVAVTGSFSAIARNTALNPLQRIPQASFPSNPSPSVTNPDPGLWIYGNAITLASSVKVAGGNGPADLVVNLVNNGTVQFGNGGAAFDNPTTQLYLNLGLGFASGQITTRSLQVQFTGQGVNQVINLTGTVNGLTGSTAASGSFIVPRTNNNYQLNGCPIQSQNCIRITTLSIPIINPFKDLQVMTPQQAEDLDVILPDVAEKDY